MASEELVLEVTAKLDQALKDVAELQKQLDAIAGGTEATVIANVEGVDDVKALAETTAELDGTAAEVAVSADDQATATLDEVQGGVEAIDGVSAEVEVEAEDNATDVLEDTEDIVDDLDGATAEVEVEADTGDAVSNLTDVTSAIKDVAAQAGIGGAAMAGLGAAVAAIGKIGMQAFEFTGRVEELSLFTGAALEESSKLLAVLESYTGIDVGRLENSIGRLADKLAATPDLAAQLGINLSGAADPLDLFVETVDALNSGQLEATERIALGIDLFGRGGLKAVNEIAASMDGPLRDAMSNVSEERVISEADLAAADELEAALGEIKDQLAGMAQVIGEKIIPPLKVLLEQLTAGPRDADVFGLDEMSDAFLNFQDNLDGFEDKLNRFVELGGSIDHLVGGTFDLADAMAAARAGIPLDEFENLIPALEVVDGKLVEVTESAELVPRALDEINDSLIHLGHTSAAADQNWRVLLKDMEDGAIDTVAAGIAFHNLQTALNLTNEEMDALVAQKLDDHMAEIAAAEKAAAAEALRFAEALADTQDAIDNINVDDLANIAADLDTALQIGGVAVDLQVEEAQVRGQVAEVAEDIQEFVDDHGAIDWSVVLDPTKSAEGFDAGLAKMIGGLQNSVQTGVVNAFQSGGVPAAEAFVNEFIPQLTALGMSEAQAREFMGIPADGNIPLFLQLQINKEAKADALAILNSIAGVDPNNPAIAYLQLQVQTGAIDPVIAEIAALLLAQKYGVEVRPELGQFSPEQIAAAEATLTNNPVTVPVEADTTVAEDDIGEVENAPHETTIAADANTQEAARQLLDETTRQRQATIYAIASIASAKAALDSLKDRRTASILAVAFTAGAEYELNHTARRRDSYIYQHVVPVGGGGGGGTGGIPGAGTLAAPAAGPALMTAPMTTDGEIVGTPSPMSVPSSGVAVVSTAPSSVVNNMQVTVQAAVIGNRHEVERTVAKALRSYTRLNGSRN